MVVFGGPLICLPQKQNLSSVWAHTAGVLLFLGPLRRQSKKIYVYIEYIHTYM